MFTYNPYNRFIQTNHISQLDFLEASQLPGHTTPRDSAHWATTLKGRSCHLAASISVEFDGKVSNHRSGSQEAVP